jgi:hypothetical protein
MRAPMRVLLAVLLLSCACVKRVDGGNVVANTVQLLHDTPERETARITELRADLEFDTKEQPREAHVVAKGETGLLESNGGRVRLFGDAKATTGISVDNVVFLEVLSPDGKVLNRAAVGFTEGLIMGKEAIDLLGRQAFNFEPGEVNLSALVPEKGPWKLRATVLDNYGVGRCTDVFVVIDSADTAKDDLRGQ